MSNCLAFFRTMRGRGSACFRATSGVNATAMLLFGFLVPNAGMAAVTYVQSNSTALLTPQSSVTVTFTAAQAAGNLNVVAVGWENSTSTPSSISDSKGNTYALAVGPTTISGLVSQSVYYAKNIAAATAGSNTVTVTFSSSVPYPDVRIAEYSGLNTTNPLDVTAAATGTGTTMSTGSVTTLNASDLLVGSNMIAHTTSAAGSGYTIRVQSSNQHIIEDRTVSATGSYSASATQDISGYWLMQMVAFKAAAGSGDTQAPTAPTGLTATPASSTQVNLGWTASTDNVAVTGYSVERCQGIGCTTFAAIGTPTGTTFSDTGRTASTTYRYQVRARDAVPNWSAYSTIATATTPAAGDTQAPTNPSALTVTAGASQNVLSWTASTDNVGVVEYRVERCAGPSCSVFSDVGGSGITGTSWTDTGASAGTSYSYRVRARDAVPNYSGYSNTATATPADCD